MGCGNGLLVYILNDQGFKGYGIDMRKRKIWSNTFYLESKVNLIEQTIDPRSCNFEDVDWLIGNHSDELSPWLPVIALKSSKQIKCNFFLIPCCFFDFTSKFEVKKKGESRYDTYLQYLKEVCQACGFNVIRDKLRIPSTKNVCFICSINTNKDSEPNIDLNLKKRVFDIIVDSNSLKEFSVDFKARDLQMEKDKSTRNCTKNVEFELKNFIIKKVLENLLIDSKESKCVFIKKEDGSEWNAGSSLTLGEIANLFDKDTLNKLKLECGGISITII
jgi:tRNASer (uridine44-2'-O)-methyltransferase